VIEWVGSCAVFYFFELLGLLGLRIPRLAIGWEGRRVVGSGVGTYLRRKVRKEGKEGGKEGGRARCEDGWIFGSLSLSVSVSSV